MSNKSRVEIEIEKIGERLKEIFNEFSSELNSEYPKNEIKKNIETIEGIFQSEINNLRKKYDTKTDELDEDLDESEIEIKERIEESIKNFEKGFPKKTITFLFDKINKVFDESEETLNKNKSFKIKIIENTETRVNNVIEKNYDKNKKALQTRLKNLKQKPEKKESKRDMKNDVISLSRSTDEHQRKISEEKFQKNFNIFIIEIDILIDNSFKAPGRKKIADLFEKIQDVFTKYEEKFSIEQIKKNIEYIETQILENQTLTDKQKSTVGKNIKNLKIKYQLGKKHQQLIKLIFRYLDPLIVWGEMNVGKEFKEEFKKKEKTQNDISNENIILYFIMKFTRDFCSHIGCFFNEKLLLCVHSNIQNLYKAFGVDLSLKKKLKKIYETKEYKQIHNEQRSSYFYLNDYANYYELNVEKLKEYDVDKINTHIKEILEIKENYSLRERMCLLFGYALHYLVGTRDNDWALETITFSGHNLDKLTKNNEKSPQQNSSN